MIEEGCLMADGVGMTVLGLGIQAR